MRNLADFEIWIEPAYTSVSNASGARYPVHVFDSPAGPASEELGLDSTDPEFENLLRSARSEEPDLNMRRQFGERLFNALFTESVRDSWLTSRARISENSSMDGLRIRLGIHVPEIAVLPWELMYEPNRGFLGASNDIVLSRYLRVAEPPRQKVDDKLRVLLVLQRPSDLPKITDAEVDSLKDSISDIGESIDLEVSSDESIPEIANRLQRTDFHIVHFLGHGVRGKLALIGPEDTWTTIGDVEFAQLFLGSRSIRLIILNACHSSQSEGDGLFTGMGPALIQKQIPAVIAMQYPNVQVEAAAKFSTKFYASLANGLPVDVSVNQARNLLSVGESLHDRDWSSPILYMGTRQGKILEWSNEQDEDGSDLVDSLRALAMESEEAMRALEALA